MAEWDSLPTDILVLIAKRVEYFEDFFSFYAVCKSWHSVTSVLGKFLPLPSRFPFVMLTDKAEMNYPQITNPAAEFERMQNRQFFSFSNSKVYEFELPEVTGKKCLGVGYGLLLTVDYDLQINILNPFTRQQIGLPSLFSLRKVAMSSNPYNNNPSNQEDCIIMAIHGEFQTLAFARPGDDVWTEVDSGMGYEDVGYYNGKFYAVNWLGYIDVCDINDAKASHIARGPDHHNHKYLVESSSGDLLMVLRESKGPFYSGGDDRPYKYTVGFSIFKLEESGFTEVKNLGNKALFIGNNASVSVPCSRCIKANTICFSDNEMEANSLIPYGGGYDTGIYDVESGEVQLHTYRGICVISS